VENADVQYMRMALKLARRGLGSVEPNPAVGCVIVKANQIVGKGWHKKFGGPHAEINALEDCQNLGVKPRGATMYVTLEPCSHEGKTGPCTEAIISAGLAKVKVATIDPSAHSMGRGVRQLREAGIEVETGLCEREARLLNASFMKFAGTGRCWVTLKWAQSIDGKLSWAGGSGGRWISNEVSRKDVQRLRRRAGAILVGINTVLADDPYLVPRPRKGKRPIRIVLDSFLRIKLTCRLLRTTKTSPVLIFTKQESVMDKSSIADRIIKKGAELVAYPDTYGRSNLHYLMDELRDRGIGELLVEGGPTVIRSFLREGLADQICVYIAPRMLGGVGGAEIGRAFSDIEEAVELNYVEAENMGGDVCISGITDWGLEAISVGKEEGRRA